MGSSLSGSMQSFVVFRFDCWGGVSFPSSNTAVALALSADTQWVTILPLDLFM